MKPGRTRSRGFWKTRVKPALSALLMMLMLYGSVVAQTGTSSVRGTVLDPDKKAMVGATVTLTSVDTNVVRTKVTNENGTFVFDLIPPGNYKLQAEAQGFKKVVVDSVRALVDKPTALEVQLEIGQLTESVSVSADSAEVRLNTQDATIGNNFVAKQITQLPLESRNVVDLLSLQPGVTREGYVSGSRSDQSNITLDGIDVNEQQTGLDPIAQAAGEDKAFSSVLRVTPDSVEEFRVTTTNPNASQGRSSGAQVSLITKGGTNQFHGGVYEFHRNTVTSANDFFNNRVGNPTPKLLRNLFGGTFGGPIKQDKLFFFFTYEGRRDASEVSVVRNVPLASLGQGQIRYPNTSGGITTLNAAQLNSLFPAGVNPAGLAALAEAARKYPANDFTLGDSRADQLLNTAGFRFNASTPLRWNTSLVKFDYNLSDKQQLFLRGNYQQDNIASAPQFPDTIRPNFWNHPIGIAVGHTWTLSNNLINKFTYGLTREAFSSQGDSAENFISFRFVFTPKLFQRTNSRTTPVQNFVDDVSWVKNSHTIQFGTNIRLVSNTRISGTNSFDSAVANPSFYDASGAVLSRPINDIAPGFSSPVRTAVSAVIGRFSQYAANFNFDRSGKVLPVGQGVGRTFATQEYDWYGQDIFKITQNLTVTYGMRYSLSRPVYESSGLQVKPTTSLSKYFDARVAGAAAGKPVNTPITIDLAGPANGRPGYYNWDKNNFQPRIAIAWSPSFKNAFLSTLFGKDGKSVLRGGFAITNDHIGQQLAVQFDLNSTLGFSSSQEIAANTYNASTRPAPRFTGFGQDIRALPNISVPSSLTFPLITPADEAQRIESSLDDNIKTPINYSWNLSYSREFKGGLTFEASYVGRRARKLLLTRDIMHLNNLVDTKSGVDWYTAAHQLADLRSANTPIERIRPIAYFENLFPNLGSNLLDDPSLSPTQAVYTLVAREGVGGFDILDWTYVQTLLDDLSAVGRNAFFHPQYAALAAFSTLGESDYHGGSLSIRERFRNQLTLDFNYTLSKSFDNASGLQTSNPYGAAFVLNPLDLRQNRAVSDFDIRHIINVNAIWELPVGKGRKFLSNLSGVAEAFFGGWQLSGIYRWNTGAPAATPFDAAQWATNWEVQSNGVRLRDIKASPTKQGASPNLFSDPKAAYQSFRNALAGEVGDRNIFRIPSYVTLDMGLGKTFTMPYNDNHKLQFRWEVFNVTNTQRLGTLLVSREGLGLSQDPDLSTPPPVFGNFTGIQGSPRVMQFGLRYNF
ncbi:MAG: carboxypeptidase regulatory-like domain-containing protein [Acidobacteria bacterium]|nr:carboxypeptidase regulatory-like domain-containing protein [Acidobacteriota bacterium]